MSSENNMAEKYQQYYNQIIVGTLNDTLIKSISFQANIKLANEIIAEQEKSIDDIKNENEELKKQLENTRTNKTNFENSKISDLENSIKLHLDTIDKLSKEKIEYENVKNQLRHLETFRNELVVAREENKKLTTEVERLTTEVESLKNKKRKITKASSVDTEEINIVSTPNDF
jgi:chromosome segregation ATPase